MNFQQLTFLFSAWQTFIKILKARGSIGLFRGWTLMSIIINYWIHFLYTASNSWKLFLTFLLRAVLQSGSFLYIIIREVIWNAPKSIWKNISSCDGIFYLKCPKIEEFHFRLLFCFKINHVLFYLKRPTFLCSRYLKCPIFRIKLEKHFNYFEHKKWNISNN